MQEEKEYRNISAFSDSFTYYVLLIACTLVIKYYNVVSPDNTLLKNLLMILFSYFTLFMGGFFILTAMICIYNLLIKFCLGSVKACFIITFIFCILYLIF